MIFYQLMIGKSEKAQKASTGSAKDTAPTEQEEKPKRTSRRRKKQFASPSQYRDITEDIQSKYENLIFPCEFPAESHLYCIITKPEKLHSAIKDYLTRINAETQEYSLKEITYQRIDHAINMAQENNLLDDNIQAVYFQNHGNMFFFSDPHETLIAKKKSKAAILKDALQSPFARDLQEEIGRIMEGQKEKCAYHIPVHYLITVSNREDAEKSIRTLAQALYSKGRVASARCVSFESYQASSLSAYRKIIEDTVTIIDLWDTVTLDDDGLSLFHSPVDITGMTKTIRETCQRTQYIFILNEKMEPNARERLLNPLSHLTFIEMKSARYSKEDFISMLTKMAEKDGMKTDENLFSLIEKDTSYSFYEICEIYQQWVSEKLKRDIFPQYSNCQSVGTLLMKSRPDDQSAYQELQQMIGLDSIKTTIDRILNYHKLMAIYRKKDKSFEAPSMHMAFTGSPGTAKTTVARLLAKILKENKILKKGVYVEVGRSDLVGMYVGWTANIVKQKFEEAKGGILFIDEAYSLLDDRKGMYGDEAINTIVQEMENNREDTLVIFGGYSEPMKEFLDRNPGLRSRVNFTIEFKDYTAEELLDIIRLMAQKKHLQIDTPAEPLLLDIFSQARRDNSFGNGRFARNLIEQALMKHSDRLAHTEGDIAAERLFLLEREDFLGLYTPSKPEIRAIGF